MGKTNEADATAEASTKKGEKAILCCSADRHKKERARHDPFGTRSARSLVILVSCIERSTAPLSIPEVNHPLGGAPAAYPVRRRTLADHLAGRVLSRGDTCQLRGNDAIGPDARQIHPPQYQARLLMRGIWRTPTPGPRSPGEIVMLQMLINDIP
jgi:hypothetical protein